jgi:phospholipid-binding lipoprotein MlaA
MTGCRGKKNTIGILTGISASVLFLFSVAAAETGTSSPFETDRQYLLAQNDTTAEDSLDDFDFLDEEEEEQETVQLADPLRGWNEAMFVFNDKAYFWVLKPAAQGYSKVIPEPARKGIKNFFYNLLMPVRFVNCIFQGKGKAATGEFGRFMLNSTVGVLGFGNPAAKYPDLNPDAEDLGQTFGRYGIGNGFYIVWPILGPSTLRDSLGDVGDWFLEPVNYVDPLLTRYSIKVGEKINSTSLRIGEYESLKDAAIDPYTAFRDVYLQYREEKVRK